MITSTFENVSDIGIRLGLFLGPPGQCPCPVKTGCTPLGAGLGLGPADRRRELCGFLSAGGPARLLNRATLGTDFLFAYFFMAQHSAAEAAIVGGELSGAGRLGALRGRPRLPAFGLCSIATDIDVASPAVAVVTIALATGPACSRATSAAESNAAAARCAPSRSTSPWATTSPVVYEMISYPCRPCLT